MRPFVIASMIVGLGALTQCSSNPPPSTTFACGSMLCDATQDYCLHAEPAGMAETYMCTTLPVAGCVGDPCQSCLTGVPEFIRCTSITVGGAYGSTVIVSQ